jgi:hypothetical protein
MFSDKVPPQPPRFYLPESSLRFGMKLAELWQEWFEAMSQVTYQTHRACEFFARNGRPSNGQDGPSDSSSWRSQSQASNDAIDLDKLKQCLQSMDTMQAARVLYAVQTMQVMEAMLKREKSRANEADDDAW